MASGDADKDEDEDEELLARWREGDKAAGQELANRYFPVVRSYFRVKAPHDYQELVAKTFFRLVEKRDKFRGESTFRAFLLGIARFILLEWFRAKKRNQRIDPLVTTAHEFGGGPGLSTLFGIREEHHLLLDVMRRMPLAKQELLELYYWQQLSAREIAAYFGVPLETVRTRLKRTIKQLAKDYTARENAAPLGPDREQELERWLHELRERV